MSAAPLSPRICFPILLGLPTLLFAFIAGLSRCDGAEAPIAGIEEKPLAALSGPRGTTLFKLLPPQETGIVTENRYADPKMWGERYSEFEVGSVGTGVTIGDFDGDGRPDLFVVNKTESCRLFRNLGNWKFEDVTERAGVGDKGEFASVWKQGATFVDVNNDGRLDLYVCRFGAPNLLYINQGDGTFREEAAARGLAISDASTMAVFCDYDRDGWLDVYLLTNILNSREKPKGQPDYLFHNNRDGTFTDVTAKAGIRGDGQGHSAVWWDFDDDGWPDLYVANDFSLPDVLYRNNGDGTFTDVAASALPHVPFSAMGSDTADVNNDGRIDLLVADMAGTTHEKDQRTMANMRAIANDPDEKTVPQFLRNALFLNTGTRHVQEAACLAGLSATNWTWSVRFEDLDNDGRVDLHVTNGMHRESHNADLMARMALAQNLEEKIRIERNSPVFAESHLAYRNLGDMRFEDVSAAWGLDQKGVAYGAAFGDLDGDGDLDLVYTGYQQGVVVLRNDSETGHRVIFELHGTQSNRIGVGATIRLETDAGIQVRQLTLARGVLSSSEPILHFGLGTSEQIARAIVSWPSGERQTFTNLAADRRYVITEPAKKSGVSLGSTPTKGDASPSGAPQFQEVSSAMNLAIASRENAIDERAQQPLLPLRQNRRGPAIAVGELGGRGRDDIVIAGTPQDPLRIYRATTEAGPFAPLNAAALAGDGQLNDGPVLIFDANGDGLNDLLVTKGGVALPAGAEAYQPKMYFNDGHGGFQLAPAGTLPEFPVSAGVVVAADMDRDGRLDIFVGARVLPGQYPFPPKSALWKNLGGRFEDITDAVAPELREIGMVTSALWSDVDGDGWMDLLVTLEWGTVRYFHNEGGRRLRDESEQAGFSGAGMGWWASIAAADFNGDGKIDYVVGNAGLNTPYEADTAHPILLYAGDFKGDGTLQLIEGYYEGDKLYPRRARRDLGAAIPSLLKRYPRTDSYARATLVDIFGETKLSAAQRFAATELRSGVFLSQRDGSYHFEALPRIAQISPIQGLAAGDFDGDGRADVYAVQNDFSPIPSVGRFDGGVSQLLRGDGLGHFQSVSPVETNLIVPGDGKALAVLDLNGDGWPDFAVTRNNSTALVFKNDGVPGKHSLSVRLQGPAGNINQVGARVTLTLRDGSTETSEVYAGSGYASQSTAALFFGYTDANPPRTVSVRWPSGDRTEHDVAPGSSTLMFAAPR